MVSNVTRGLAGFLEQPAATQRMPLPQAPASVPSLL